MISYFIFYDDTVIDQKLLTSTKDVVAVANKRCQVATDTDVDVTANDVERAGPRTSTSRRQDHHLV
jgi:hypothetical protein